MGVKGGGGREEGEMSQKMVNERKKTKGIFFWVEKAGVEHKKTIKKRLHVVPKSKTKTVPESCGFGGKKARNGQNLGARWR